jgi:hypothetical protein
MAIMSSHPVIIARLSLFYSGTVFREKVIAGTRYDEHQMRTLDSERE